jgi:hypothetical protein
MSLLIRPRLAACLLAAAFAAAVAPTLAGQDAVHFGTSIYVPPERTVHDAVCFFCSVDVEGKVNGDVVVFFGSVHIAGSTDRDVVNFFGGTRLDDGASVGKDLVNFFGSVRMGEGASVGHDLVAMMGSTQIDKTASVGNDRVVQPGLVFDVPLILMIVVLILVVREYRSWRVRRYFANYPFPPPPM